MFGVLVDVSGSMQSAYALDRSHQADVERIHAILTTLVSIVKREIAHHKRKESIFVGAFEPVIFYPYWNISKICKQVDTKDYSS